MRAAGGIQRCDGRNTLWLLSTSMLLLQSSALVVAHAQCQPARCWAAATSAAGPTVCMPAVPHGPEAVRPVWSDLDA